MGFRELTKARSIVYPKCQRYAESFMQELFDNYGYAWDIPAPYLYNEMRTSFHESKIKEDRWWLLEVIQAEHTEMWWRSVLNDPDSDDDLEMMEVKTDPSTVVDLKTEPSRVSVTTPTSPL